MSNYQLKTAVFIHKIKITIFTLKQVIYQTVLTVWFEKMASNNLMVKDCLALLR